MLRNTRSIPKVAGRLISLDGGRLIGELVRDAVSTTQEALTVEVFAHGISAASVRVPLGETKTGETLSFAVPIRRFPRVNLPCTLSARIVETDHVLDSAVTVADLDELWARMMPFRGKIEKVVSGQVEIHIMGHLLDPDDQVFELREGSNLISLAELHRIQPEGDTFYRIALPEGLLDGSEHRLTVVHRRSGLPLHAEPLRLRLDLRTDPLPTPRELLDRIHGLENQLRERYAEAFNGLAVELYRHIDNVTLNQRSNFEREISAMRLLLGLPAPAAQPPLPSEISVRFDNAVTGYGIQEVQQTSSGKRYRFVEPICGVLLPGMARGEAMRLRIQGLRRSHPRVLDGVTVALNGGTVTPTTYLNPNTESWSLTAELPERIIRQDYNTLELRLLNGNSGGEASPSTASSSVGISLITIQSAQSMQSTATPKPKTKAISTDGPPAAIMGVASPEQTGPLLVTSSVTERRTTETSPAGESVQDE